MRLIWRRDVVDTFRAGDRRRLPRLGEVAGEAMAALHLGLEALAEAGATGWIAYGTLLGLVREGRLLPHDTDIDIAVIDGADPRRIADAMERRGLVRVREVEWRGRPAKQKFMLGEVLIDLFYLQPEGAGWCDYTTFAEHSMIRATHPPVTPSVRRLGGFDLPVPEDAEGYLAHLYGEAWRKPAKAWLWYFSAANVELLMDWRDFGWLLRRWLRWRRRLRAAG